VVILDTQRVGDYDITVVRGESGSAVRDWLTDNGYACDDESVAVLDEYASEGWRFAAAKLTADASRTVTPHPLEVTFPCAAPIYPMRLTGVEAIDLQLDLFIIADRRARADHLECWQSDRLRTAMRQYSGSTGRLTPPLAERPIITGHAFGTSIGHPRVVGRCWNGCVLTHLRGVLSPEEMQEDIAIGLINHAPFHRHIFAPRAAWGIIFGALVMLIGAALPFAAVSAYRGERRPRFLRRRWVAAIILFVIVAPIVAYQCFDVYPVRRSVSPLRTHLATMKLAEALRELPAQADIESASDLRALLDNELGELDPELNACLHLDAPACYAAADDEAGILVTLYDRIAVPLPVLIPHDGGELLWDVPSPEGD
jgi:hypothetical protein